MKMYGMNDLSVTLTQNIDRDRQKIVYLYDKVRTTHQITTILGS